MQRFIRTHKLSTWVSLQNNDCVCGLLWRETWIIRVRKIIISSISCLYTDSIWHDLSWSYYPEMAPQAAKNIILMRKNRVHGSEQTHLLIEHMVRSVWDRDLSHCPNPSGQCPSARIVRIPSNRGRRICGPCSKTIPPNSGDWFQNQQRWYQGGGCEI